MLKKLTSVLLVLALALLAACGSNASSNFTYDGAGKKTDLSEEGKKAVTAEAQDKMPGFTVTLRSYRIGADDRIIAQFVAKANNNANCELDIYTYSGQIGLPASEEGATGKITADNGDVIWIAWFDGVEDPIFRAKAPGCK